MEIQNPNDFTANESAEVRTVNDDTQHWDDPVQVENAGDDYTGFLPREDTPAEMSDSFHWEEDPLETLLRELVVQQTRTADATEHLVSMMQEIVVVVGQTGGMVEGMLSGESGPKLGGPAGMILSALLPKGR